MKSDINFNTYQSPFTWRYGSEEMRQIFSELNRRKLWRKIWIALAHAQYKAGLVSKAEFEDIKKNSDKIDIVKAQEIEREIYHDLMAEIKVFASFTKVGGGKIHLGATSMDIEDNADILRIQQALEIVEEKLMILLKSFAIKIEKYQNLVCMGYTHLQPAEPTTLGYRLTLYAQDLLSDLKLLRYFKQNLRGKGIKGAVGTSASYEQLLKGKKFNAQNLSEMVMSELNLQEVTVSGQTYPRKTDLHLEFVISSIAQSLHKFCFDLRIMQSPNFGEWSEATGAKRVGSSAMPFKKNPDKAEKVCSLARYICSLTGIAWENAGQSLLERTLDDSANRRIFIPESFIAADEILSVTGNLVENLVVFENNISKNLNKYGPFSGSESVMMEAVKNGADRQVIHELVRELSMKAWDEVNRTGNNPLAEMLQRDKIIAGFIPEDRIPQLINPANHIGLAQKRSLAFVKELGRQIS